jgi:hypothetical protein
MDPVTYDLDIVWPPPLPVDIIIKLNEIMMTIVMRATVHGAPRRSSGRRGRGACVPRGGYYAARPRGSATRHCGQGPSRAHLGPDTCRSWSWSCSIGYGLTGTPASHCGALRATSWRTVHAAEAIEAIAPAGADEPDGC